MTVIGADAVEKLDTAAGAVELTVGPRDIVTPLARELARERGIAIVVDSAARSSNPPTALAQTSSATTAPHVSIADQSPPPLLRPPSPAFYRRGAPLHPATTPARLHRERSQPSTHTSPAGTDSRARVIVVGAGHVGMITAMRIAESDAVDEVVLVDVADGLAAGIALDITHAAALLGFRTKVRGVATLEAAGAADYVVITAGKPRQPGMSRSDLVTVNAGIVGSIATTAAQISPDAVLLIVTNPLDEMTHHAWMASGLPAERVIGMAGVLDTARFQALIGLDADVPAARVSALALGSHGDEMVIPLSQASANNAPIALTPAQVDTIVDRSRNSGAEVVGLLKTGSAFFAPGASAAHMVLAMVRGSDEVLAATVRARGEYGITDGYVGLPVTLGRHGLKKIVELPLTADEVESVRSAARRIAERVASLELTDAS